MTLPNKRLSSLTSSCDKEAEATLSDALLNSGLIVSTFVSQVNKYFTLIVLRMFTLN